MAHSSQSADNDRGSEVFNPSPGSLQDQRGSRIGLKATVGTLETSVGRPPAPGETVLNYDYDAARHALNSIDEVG